MIEEMLRYAAHHWLNIGSAIFLLIIFPIRHWSREIAIKKIANQLNNDEYIVYKPRFDFLLEIYLPVLLGGSVLRFILSSFIFTNYFDSLPLIITIQLFFLTTLSIGLFLACCTNCVITNQRIISAWSFDFLKKLDKILDYLNINMPNITLLDIDSVEIKGFYRSLSIKTKSGMPIYPIAFENTNKVKSVIETQITLLNSME